MRTLAFGALMGIAVSAPGVSLVSVEEAYRLIPHRQTIFQPASARMPAPDRAYLVAFFSAIDQAIVAKVSSRRGSTVDRAYAPVWQAWQELRPPAALKPTQDKVKSAILDQQEFLLELEKKQSGWNLNHPKVQSASGNLRAAYDDLMRIFRGENAANKQAFFDHLCALDFI